MKNNYKKFDYGIKLNIEKNTCIALLLIEDREGSSIKEVILLLINLMEKLSYIINYVRIINLKKTLVEKTEDYPLQEISKEEIMFIQKFTSLIYSQTNEEKIKNYSKIILEKADKLGDKHD
ncbi:MAG: hypothetical protein KBF12_03835 [Sebaldella sp.]|nr:hypothetical protein [Sebaldella sp.]